MANTGQGITVYSFDGSTLDASGLSQLLILENIAGRWAWDRDGDDREGEDVRVSEMCDMVGGTGLGGFYAILFSLDMTIGQVIASHMILQNVVFSSREWKQNNVGGCGALLNFALERILEDTGVTVNLDSPFLAKSSLKCFICVLNNLNAGLARGLRNYRSRASKSPRYTIREAFHATLADGTHLPPVDIQDEQFINASSGFANSSYELMKELPSVFPKGSKLATFVNLGAGHPGLLPISIGSWDEHAKLLRNTDAVAQNLMALCHNLGQCYFRLSVTRGAASCSEASSVDNTIRIVKSDTNGYLEEVGAELEAIIVNLVGRHGVVSLERLGSLAAEDGKARLLAQVDAVYEHIVHIKTIMDKDIHRSIKEWLTPIDQTAKLDASVRARSPSTCDWLWDHPEVVEWRRTGGIFWCHAGMGTGKTIIMSHVTDTLRNLPDECAVGYYYFEFTNPSTLSEEALFRSIFSQLSYLDDITSRQLYDNHRNGSLQPQLATLHNAVHALVTTATYPVYIIIDALDELPVSQRKYLLETLLKRFSPSAHGIYVMVTSRDEVDIHEILASKVSLDFAIAQEMVKHDIRVFVQHELSAPKWQAWPQEDVQFMQDTLIEKAGGMFRMVACQFVVLNHAQTSEDMQRALTSLPATLDNTYLYILDSIPLDLRISARTLFCILVAAFKPVTLAELSTLLAVELGYPDDDCPPVYQPSRRYHQPQNLIGLGTALVSQTKYARLQLAHASVKEFFLRTDHLHWCVLDDYLSHTTTAKACLALLIHNEESLEFSHADLQYTISHWWKHISSYRSQQLLLQQQKLFHTFPWSRSSAGSQLAGLEQLVETMLNEHSELQVNGLGTSLHSAALTDSQMKLFAAPTEKGGDVKKTWAGPSSTSGFLDFRSRIDLGSALRAAAWTGSLNIVELLVEKGAEVNMQGRLHGSALQAAARRGALNIVEFLVQNGAAVNMQGGECGSALHAAVRAKALDIVEFLVEKGADVNIVWDQGGSPLDVAEDISQYGRNEGQDIISFLIKKGARRYKVWNPGVVTKQSYGTFGYWRY
ncbi:hypothetical protein DL96DRAFT_1814185 [Flagelloscypha sp. PMI_526]|nr:hypothetical protein DL96DRAFT_1814185 [Flagelloscypha sp. PMI_526]